MNKIVCWLLLCLCQYSAAQEVLDITGVACGIHGSSKYGSRTYALNELKNRYYFPQPADYDTTITLQKMVQASEYAFSPSKAVVVTGYVYRVKTGGVESCNCRSKDPAYMDTHIELVVSRNQTGPAQRVIAEVTPRLRLMMADKGEDWSTATLRKALVGRRVKIAGWLLYDREHATEDFADDPGDSRGGQNWRASSWEIHPITYIQILSGGSRPDDRTIPNQQNPPAAPAPAPSETNYFIWGFAIAAVLILLYLLFKKK